MTNLKWIFVLFPIISRFLFKIKGYVGLDTGMVCNILCIASLFGSFFIPYIIYVNTHYNTDKIPYNYTFSEFWQIPDKQGYNLKYWYFATFLILDICVFLLIICFIEALMLRMTENNQIFNFIFGFSLTFEIPFFIGFLASLNVYNDEKIYKLTSVSAAELIFCFQFTKKIKEKIYES